MAGAGTPPLGGQDLVPIAGLLALGSIGSLGFAAYLALNADGQPYGVMGAFVLGMYALTGLLGAVLPWVIARRIEGGA